MLIYENGQIVINICILKISSVLLIYYLKYTNLDISLILKSIHKSETETGFNFNSKLISLNCFYSLNLTYANKASL